MRKLRKQLYQLVVTLVVVLGVAGVAAAEVELRFWAEAGEADVAFYEEAVRRYHEKHPEVRIVFEPQPGDFEEKFIVQAVAGVGPDVLHVWSPHMNVWAANDLLLDLTSYWKRDAAEINPDDYFSGTTEALTIGGKLVALPTWVATSAVLYNKDIFNESGIPFPDGTWTWDTLVQQGRKVTKTGPEGNITRWFYSGDGYRLVWSTGPVVFVWGAGGSVLSEAKDTFTLGSDAARRGLSFWYDMTFQKNIAYPPAEAYEHGRWWWDQFVLGNIAYWDTPSWNLGFVASGAAFNWDVAPPAKDPETGGRGVFRHVRGIAVSKTSSKTVEAWKFAKFIASPEMQSLRAQMSSQQPTRLSAIEAFWNQLPGGRNVKLQVFSEMIPVGRSFPRLDDPEADVEFNRLIQEQWARVWNQEIPLDQFFDIVGPRVEALLQ